MKKTYFLLVLGLLLVAQPLLGQNWSALSDNLNKPPTLGISINGNEAIFAGPFTETANGVISPVAIKYNKNSGQFSTISGFDSITDRANGFFQKNGSLYVYGKFKNGSLFYGALIFNSSFTSASPASEFQFKGPFAPFAEIESAGVNGSNDVMIFGDTLARMGSGMGVNLMASKVGLLAGSGSVTAITALTPAHPSETAAILTFGWDGSKWVVEGNFNNLGATEATDLAVYDGAVTAVNTSSNANLYCKGYSTGFLGWNGTVTSGGINSPGCLKLNGATLQAVGSGWPIATNFVGGNNNLIFATGKKNGNNGSVIASFNQNNGTWTNRQTNLLIGGFDTVSVFGLVSFSGDSTICFGNFGGNNSNFPGMALAVIQSVPLPVELIHFTARLVGKNVELQWETASEHENKGFHIERSPDGINWTTLAFVFGNGTTIELHDYSYTDEEALKGKNYYRLRQLDFDGKETLSPIVIVEMPADTFNLYPNPSDNRIWIEFVEAKKSISITFFDASGGVVLNRSIEEAEKVSLDIRDLLDGTYVAQIQFEGKTQTVKFVVAR